MRKISDYALGGLGAAATVAILVMALEMSVAAMPVPRGAEPAVDRTLKGDRQPVHFDARFGSGPVRTVPTHELMPSLPEGCIAATEWVRGKIYTAEIAGRCLA